MAEPLEGFVRILHHEGFLQAGGVHAKGKRRNPGNGVPANRQLLPVPSLKVLQRQVAIQVGVQRVATGLAEQHVIGLVLDQDVEEHLGAPLHLSQCLGFTKVVPVNHQSSLRGISEVMLQQV